MTKDDLTKAIGDVSDIFILESMHDGPAVVELHSDEVANVKPTRTRTVRRIIVAAVAACLVLVLGTAAFAVDGGLLNLFRDVFHYTGTEQEQTLDELNSGDVVSCDSNGTTVYLQAAVSDSSMCYISLRVDAPEGAVLKLPEQDVSVLQLVNPDDWVDLLTKQGSGNVIFGESSCVWSDPVPGDNSLNVTILYTAQTGISSFFDSGGIIVTIHNIWMQSPEKGYTLFLEGDWSLNLTLEKTKPQELDVNGLDVKGLQDGSAVEWNDESITLETMSVSPLSLDVTYAYTSPDSENMIPSPGTVELVMKDGSIVETTEGNGWISDTECGEIFIYSAPVNLSDVDYIQFGDCEIPVA